MNLLSSHLVSASPHPARTVLTRSSQFGAELRQFADQHAEAELQGAKHQRASRDQSASVTTLAKLWQSLLLRCTIIH